MRIIGIIPARLESSRFPGKPLAKILGIPMIGHVYSRCKMSKILDEVYVATCNIEIFNYIESIGGKAIMTSNAHERASDRTAEALLKIEVEKKYKLDIIVMLQGDEPMVVSEMIESAVKPLVKDENILVSNLMSKIKNKIEWEDPNEVKLVKDLENNAIYFSREPIPSNKKYSDDFSIYKQVCVIPFRREALIKYTKLEPTPLEVIESVDMNRFLEHGYKVKLVETNYETLAVDTLEDLKKVEIKMKKDSLIKLYKN
jgi:3-deoxy-manno-octulosonate cytidylyltransferase (CMP-KDO synthetase)